ncbi:Diaminopimelate epimerase [hydrothermal vent metagenome]|uniref:diaminopimelate epimerase n=1 Tax=hydrothermal vent metagenome TaxID=652676 RepID=A0A3B1BV07_9ZZZZ
MTEIKFTKMHGLGNDFVMIDLRRKKAPGLNKKAALICDRRFGIGCDQMIVIAPSKKADYRMTIYNADGSEVEMCGNGIRCFAKYLWDRKERKIRRKKALDVETLAGIIRPRIVGGGMIEVDMGEPGLEGVVTTAAFKGQGPVVNRPLKAGGKTYTITAVSMGNPHCVIFTSDVDKIDLAGIGPDLERHKAFPNRTNVEFVEALNRKNIKVRVFERGSGATLACGTGACAAVVACVLNKKTGRKVSVHLPGGTLKIEWTKSNRVLMTGPAEEVYSGVVNI